MTTTVQRTAAAATTLALLALAPAVHAGATGGQGQGDGPVATAAAKKKQKTVGIFDNYYEPAKLKVVKGTTIVWKWPTVTGDSHDVTLDSGPKGVKKFQSPVAAAQFKYKRTLDVPGKYHIICTLHEEMTQDITVTKR